MITKIRLRPHHLLCIQNYQGKGYDEAFTDHMNEVVCRLAADPKVLLTEGCDELCSACPNRIRGGAGCGMDSCISEDKVQGYDREVLRVCGLEAGTTERWSVLADAAQRLVLQTEEFDRICGDCQWAGLCMK